MNRRDFAAGSLSLLAAGLQKAAAQTPAAQMKADDMHSGVPSGKPQEIAMVLYPQMTALDLIGPHTFLAGLGNVNVHLISKDLKPLACDNGLILQPSMTLADCPSTLDILFIGGGSKGTLALMKDREMLSFLADRGSRARFVTSVCTGSLVLGAAGLLRGYKATSHWAVRDVLPLFGATLTSGRVVEDRNRITAGGVTAGIDFGLRLTARMRGEHYAEMLQLAFEYDPQPPFHAGSPDSAPEAVTAHMRSRYAGLLTEMRGVAKEVTKTWAA